MVPPTCPAKKISGGQREEGQGVAVADSNDLRLGPILALNPKFKQCVTEATHNLSILDPIITDLHPFYQVPIVMEPLEADTETGEMSDHKMVLMKPLNTIDCEKKVETKTTETRVFSEDNFATMGRKLENFDWKFLESYPFINDRMEIFHNTLLGLFSECFPLKKRIIYSDSEPYINDLLVKLRRKRNREYNKRRRSQKYIELESRYRDLLSKSMKRFYRKRIQSLKSTSPRQWYKNLKKLAGYDTKEENPVVEDIKHLSDNEQAEHIAESFSKISNDYAPLDRSKIRVEDVSKGGIFKTNAKEVFETISSLNSNKAVPRNDIPTRILKRFSSLLCGPIAGLINDCIAEGVWPDFLKVESVTPKRPSKYSLIHFYKRLCEQDFK